MTQLIDREWIRTRIVLLRGEKVILSSDLATIYGVEPRVLVQAVKRNLERFPQDFMFQVTENEAENLKSQIVISSWGGVRTLPYAFTEQGIAMLSSVLRSPIAIAINIEIIREFANLRRLLISHHELAFRLAQLEEHCDHQFKALFDAIKSMFALNEQPKREIGINSSDDES